MASKIVDLDPREDLKFFFRWRKWLKSRNPNGTTQIISSTWSKAVPADPLTILDDDWDEESSMVKVRGLGGIIGAEYVFVNQIETTDGEKPVRTLLARMINRGGVV